MGYIQGIMAEQTWLLPYSIEELIEENNPVRVIEAYADSLCLEGLGFARAVPAQTGRPAYDPRDMLKLYIYGYLNRLRSSRRLMLECRRNVELYNIQTVVDDDSHIIVSFETTNVHTDQGQLSGMAEQTKKELKLETAEFKADKGYESREDILKCVMNGSIPDVGFKYDRERRFYDLEYKPAEITEEIRQSTKPQDIQACIHAGVLPACYENSTISVELQRKSVVSCFIRHEDGTVTCPVGRELFKQAEKKYGTVYKSHEACRTCPNRCTDSPKPKEVNIGRNSIYVPVYMYGDSKVPLQKLPDIAQDSPYNAFGRRKQDETRIRLTIRRDPDLMQKRKEVVEHPFGTIKWYDGAHYFLCRGKEMVSAEIALSFLSYNLRRAIKMLGVGVLIARIKERKRKNEG